MSPDDTACSFSPFLKFPQKGFQRESRLDAGSSERLDADLQWPEKGLPHTCYGSEPDMGLKRSRFFLKSTSVFDERCGHRTFPSSPVLAKDSYSLSPAGIIEKKIRKGKKQNKKTFTENNFKLWIRAGELGSALHLILGKSTHPTVP